MKRTNKKISLKNDVDQQEVRLENAGLGDVIKQITNKLGFEECEGCEHRRKVLNNMFPFLKLKRDFSDDEILFINDINNRVKTDHNRFVLNADSSEIDKLFKIYNDVFNTNMQKCTTCAGVLKAVLERLNNFI